MRLIIGILLGFAVFYVPAFSDESFEKLSGLDEDLHSLAISPFKDKMIFVGSSKAVFRSGDQGRNFKKIFVIKGDLKKVNYILFDPYQHGKIFVATGSGLYVTSDLGQSFRKIFKAQDEEGSFLQCLTLGKDKGLIYLGTNRGLYLGEDDVYVFRKASGIPKFSTVYDIKVIPQNETILVATSAGLYAGKPNENDFARVFISRSVEEPPSGFDEEESLRNIPMCVYQDPKNPADVYLGTSSGLFISNNLGRTFKKLTLAGLEGLSIKRIQKVDHESSDIYLAAGQGFYRLSLDEGLLTDIYKGLHSKDVRDFSVDDEKNIFLSTAKGLFRSESGNLFGNGRTDNADNYLRLEPGYGEIQEAALRYNDIHPDKTKFWRKSLLFRALFPTVSLDYDKIVTYDSGSDVYYTGPNDWGVSFSWDVGDLIWNSYQDDIDTRTRLNTQTRIDILDDLRRIYFERRKLKLELTRRPPAEEDELAQKQLYLEELNAALDSYTGGYFSKRIEELKKQTQ
ncbi:MAG: hypothetical protein JW734_09750 [Candidatus Omnitrophica bacterium]|nr:hypothetical protein [Candidatus Omnitrophota bacterium]